MWKDKITSLEKQIRYCKRQIKTHPNRWVIREYQDVVKKCESEILECKKTIQNIKRLN